MWDTLPGMTGSLPILDNPCTQYFMFLVPKTILFMVFGAMQKPSEVLQAAVMCTSTLVASSVLCRDSEHRRTSVGGNSSFPLMHIV